MTITTAKPGGGRVRALPALVAALLAAPQAQAGWTFAPTLQVRETWSDNVLLESEANAKSSFIHEVTPGFRLSHRGPRLVLNSTYQLNYYNIQNDDVRNTNRSSRLLRADGKASVVEQLLYVDATASIQQRAVSPFAQEVEGGGYITSNRQEVKAWRISPYLVHRFGASATGELRYVRDSVDAGLSGLGNTDGDTLSLNLNSGSNFRTLGWGFAASSQKIQDEVRNDSEIKTANLNLRWRAGRTLTLLANAGYDDYDYDSLGGANSGRAWSTGFQWTPSSRSNVQATVGRRYFGPSRTLSAQHRSRRTVWSINYSDTVSTTRANFLIPSAVDTAALLDGLFLPNFPDPVERARAVEAYIRLNQLPPSLADNINYFSNRYMLQKQLRATMAWRGARSGATVSVFRIRRDALSVRETDSILLGNSLSSINDDVKQAGVDLQLNYRLTPRSTINLLASATDNESLTTGFASRANTVRLNARHQLRPKMFGTIELRHLKGNTSFQVASPYTENALAASLTMQL